MAALILRGADLRTERQKEAVERLPAHMTSAELGRGPDGELLIELETEPGHAALLSIARDGRVTERTEEVSW